MRPRLPLFAFAALLPLPLIAIGAVWGHGIGIAALVYITAFTALMDGLLPAMGEGADAPPRGTDALSVALAIGQLALLPLVVWALAGGIALRPVDWITTFLAMSLWAGQTGNSNAHELIHRPTRELRRLGVWVYISILFGHHASAHPKVHHRFVATPLDPNSARLGEGFYHFYLRAWRGSFVAGLRAEARDMDRANRPRWRNPYVGYLIGAALVLTLAFALGGVRGLAIWIAIAAYAQVQLLLSDYVQHYGLSRREVDGKFEPTSPRHSWNAPHLWSSALMLNAPRHSDHHANPMRPYPALRLPGGAPILPHPLPVMAVIALFPPVWRRIMSPRARTMAAG